jgi:phosphonate transport system substrate-binding protein
MIKKRATLFAMILVLFLTAAAETVTAKPLRLGITSSLSIRDAFECYRPLLEYLQCKLEIPVEMVLREEPWEIDDLLRQGTIDGALISPRSYVKNRMQSELELLVAPQINGEPAYYAYIILLKNSEISDLFGLLGKRIASGALKSMAGEFAPLGKIEEKISIKPEKFFGAIHYMRGLDEGLSLIASGQVDSAYIDSIAYDYAVKRKLPYASETRILLKSSPIAVPPLVVKKGMDSALKSKLKEIFLTMHANSEGKRILDDLDFDKFIVPNKSIYNGLK